MSTVISTLGAHGLAAPSAGAFDVDTVTRAIGGLDLARCGSRIGVDVVRVADVAASIERFGERYLDRIFTAHERSCCTGSAAVNAASLAARLAAKEAAIKVLRPSGAQPDWRSMEVVRQPHGACDIAFHDAAAELARAAGLHSPAVSLTHEGGVAVAVVIALLAPGSAPAGATWNRDGRHDADL